MYMMYHVALCSRCGADNRFCPYKYSYGKIFVLGCKRTKRTKFRTDEKNPLYGIWRPSIFGLQRNHTYTNALACAHACLLERTVASQVIAFGGAAEAQLEVLEIRSHIGGYHAYSTHN